MKFGLEPIKDFTKLVRELAIGLTRLTFTQNFEAFQTEITIPANSTLAIRNQLSFIPSGRIILRQDAEAVISDSTTDWSLEYVYLQNHHATNPVTLTVLFLR
jgi:hypothetical protein